MKETKENGKMDRRVQRSLQQLTDALPHLLLKRAGGP